MRRVIRKQVRRSEGGLNVAADLDAVIAVNTGADAEASHTVVRSSHSVVQGATGRSSAADTTSSNPKDSPKEKS